MLLQPLPGCTISDLMSMCTMREPIIYIYIYIYNIIYIYYIPVPIEYKLKHRLIPKDHPPHILFYTVHFYSLIHTRRSNSCPLLKTLDNYVSDV